jgi:predicted ribosomally synthesized peptide with nif11-like leader
MPVQVVVDFIAKVEKDPALAAAVEKVEEGNLEELCQVARDAGFDFTVKDWKQTVTRPQTDELDDEQLSQVSGGVDPLRTQTTQQQLPTKLKSFGGTIVNPNDQVSGLDWSIGRLDV